MHDCNNQLLNSYIPAIAVATANMTSLSTKKVAAIAEKYKSENTKEYILKGFNIYWLAVDTCRVKVKADNLDVQEPTENEIDQPEPVPTQQKKSTYFKQMYVQVSNKSISNGTNHFSTKHSNVKGSKMKRSISPQFTPEDEEEKEKYDTQNEKVAYVMNIPSTYRLNSQDKDNVKIMVMDHIKGNLSLHNKDG